MKGTPRYPNGWRFNSQKLRREKHPPKKWDPFIQFIFASHHKGPKTLHICHYSRHWRFFLPPISGFLLNLRIGILREREGESIPKVVQKNGQKIRNKGIHPTYNWFLGPKTCGELGKGGRLPSNSGFMSKLVIYEGYPWFNMFNDDLPWYNSWKIAKQTLIQEQLILPNEFESSMFVNKRPVDKRTAQAARRGAGVGSISATWRAEGGWRYRQDGNKNQLQVGQGPIIPLLYFRVIKNHGMYIQYN